jgi:hypothetical protein
VGDREAADDVCRSVEQLAELVAARRVYLAYP